MMAIVDTFAMLAQGVHGHKDALRILGFCTYSFLLPPARLGFWCGLDRLGWFLVRWSQLATPTHPARTSRRRPRAPIVARGCCRWGSWR